MQITFTWMQVQTQARQLETDPSNLLGDLFYLGELCGEAGELFNKAKKKYRKRLKHWKAKPVPSFEEISDELADVVICAFIVAYRLGIDLNVAVPAKFNRDSNALELDILL